MPRGPIFIGGPDRCGKTLLAAILGSHSRIAIPIVGSNLWTFFYEQYGDLADDRNLERCLSALMSYKHARFLQPDVASLRRELDAGERSYERLFALIHEQFAERAGKPRWGDQTGLIERYAHDVLAAYPDAVMIHMIRDPRDRYEASLRLWPNGRARAGGAAARWGYSVRLAERNMRRHPGRYRIVRYEDLVQRPEEVVRG
ncbi:MAG: sulfotransferase family protein, partial [Candidatus Limnocylindria bacterium]